MYWLYRKRWFSSVQFSCSVVSDSLQPHELQHTRPHCLSPTPRAYANSCLLSWWCHPTISSSVVPFSSCPQSFTASGSFQMSQLFSSGGQSIGVRVSAINISPSNEHQRLICFWMDWLNEQTFEQTPEDGEGQGSLVYCSQWGRKELDMTGQVNWTEIV